MCLPVRIDAHLVPHLEPLLRLPNNSFWYWFTTHREIIWMQSLRPFKCVKGIGNWIWSSETKKKKLNMIVKNRNFGSACTVQTLLSHSCFVCNKLQATKTQPLWEEDIPPEVQAEQLCRRTRGWWSPELTLSFSFVWDYISYLFVTDHTELSLKLKIYNKYKNDLGETKFNKWMIWTENKRGNWNRWE